MSRPNLYIFELRGNLSAKCVPLTTSSNLCEYLESRDLSKHRVFLAEGTHDKRFNLTVADKQSICRDTCSACVLTRSLGVPEQFFREHEKQNITFALNEEFHVPKLPSRLEPSKTFHLSYFDLRTFEGDPSSILFQSPVTKQHLCPGSDGDLKMTCSRTQREIQCHEWHNRNRGPLFIVPRKCSFWVKEYSGGGWDGKSAFINTSSDFATYTILTAIVLCDPELSTANVDTTLVNLTPHSPFNPDHFDDYLPQELASDPDAPAVQSGPPRKGMFQDLHYCFTNYAHILKDQQNPRAATVFLRKIVTTHYEPLLAFSLHQTRSMRSRGWALKGDTEEQKIEAAIVESEWSRFRFSEYLETMQENLDALGIARSNRTHEFRTDDWQASDFDFQWIHQQLIDRRRDYELLTGSMAALAGIIGNRKTVTETSRVSEEAVLSRREARAMKTFTVLALAFATLSLTSSWFSMGDHAPGEEGFRIYWVVALPITILVCILALITDHGFTEEPEWSLGAALKSLRRNSRKYTRRRAVKTPQPDDGMGS
jgi:hypothetical protein